MDGLLGEFDGVLGAALAVALTLWVGLDAFVTEPEGAVFGCALVARTLAGAVAGRGAGIANAGVKGAALTLDAPAGDALSIGAPAAIAKSLLFTRAPTSSIARPRPTPAFDKKADRNTAPLNATHVAAASVSA